MSLSWARNSKLRHFPSNGRFVQLGLTIYRWPIMFPGELQVLVLVGRRCRPA
jgi:hypothetical protein